MNRLSTLIDRLSELADTASVEHRPELIRQVTDLCTDFNRQQERYAAFLQLMKEYADRFLSDISEKIQQQSFFLDALEKWLDMAKCLHEKVVCLRESYEVGTLKHIKKVQDTSSGKVENTFFYFFLLFLQKSYKKL